MTSKKQPKNQSNEELEQLRYLLFGEERSRINELDQRVTDFNRRVKDVSEVLPSAFHRVTEHPALEEAIEDPMMRTIRASIKRDTHAFAEYLFPVMGPAIRRAVADALKSLVQRINIAMEHNFSAKGIRWRLEAARTGVPFTQIVLRHTMMYTVQEAFLVSRETGLMLAHARRDEHLVLDEDAVAAMLSAIQSFIQDSLGLSADDPLRSAELGDRTLWVINGPSAMLACVILGTPPRAVREELLVLLETIHARYGERFIENNNSLMEDTGLRSLVQRALREEVDDQAEQGARRKVPMFWVISVTLLLLFTGWKVWQGYQQRELESQMVESFRSQPGYLVASVRHLDGQLVIEGLRDPGAAQPSDVLAGENFPPQDIKLQFKPFWSLEPVLVLQRLRTSMQLSDSTSLELKGGVLRVDGVLGHQQRDRLIALAGSHPLIDSVDMANKRMNSDDALKATNKRMNTDDALKATNKRMNADDALKATNKRMNTDDALKATNKRMNADDAIKPANKRMNADDAIKLAREQLGAPDTVMFAPLEGDIALSGSSDIPWFLDASSVPRTIGGWEIDFQPLRDSLQKQLRADAVKLHDTVFLFGQQNKLTRESEAAIEVFGESSQHLLRSADLLGISLQITLVGEADGTGSPQQHARVVRERVQVVKVRLISAGVAADRIRSEYSTWKPGDKNMMQRRVVIRILEGHNP